MDMKEIWKEYEAFAPTSKKLHEEAVKVIPGGVSANIKYFDPFPLHMKGEPLPVKLTNEKI